MPVLHTTGLFVVMRTTEAVLWPEPFADTRPRVWFEHYREAYTKPPLFDADARAFEWDHDHWTINVLGHGLLGSELYFRPRRCGAPVWAAALFAASASAAWEYGFEANGVRPSALDLVFTPAAGVVLGEGRFWVYSLAQKLRSRELKVVLQTLVDPLGEFERALSAPC